MGIHLKSSVPAANNLDKAFPAVYPKIHQDQIQVSVSSNDEEKIVHASEIPNIEFPCDKDTSK